MAAEIVDTSTLTFQKNVLVWPPITTTSISGSYLFSYFYVFEMLHGRLPDCNRNIDSITFKDIVPLPGRLELRQKLWLFPSWRCSQPTAVCNRKSKRRCRLTFPTLAHNRHSYKRMLEEILLPMFQLITNYSYMLYPPTWTTTDFRIFPWNRGSLLLAIFSASTWFD